MAELSTRAAVVWCVAVVAVLLALWSLMPPHGVAGVRAATDGGRLAHPWDRTFTCDPHPAPGVVFATPPASAADATYFGADRPRCDGYTAPTAPHGPFTPGARP